LKRRTSVTRLRFLFGSREPQADTPREADEHPPVPEPEPPPEPAPPVPEPRPPTPEPGEPPPRLRSMPAPEPEREPGQDDDVRAPERVVRLPLDGAEPREWNVWELERLAQAAGGGDTARDEELTFLLLELRQFANADGQLPVDFDPVVRESFGELIYTAV
jgi:outer membrane biosynthesis protein TonB